MFSIDAGVGLPRFGGWIRFGNAAHPFEEKGTETGQATAPDETNGSKTDATSQEGIVGDGVHVQNVVVGKDY